MNIKMASDSSVTVGKGSCILRYRRSASASIGAESTKCLPARSCDKCQIRSNLFAKSRSENHSEGWQSKCTGCGLLQKQKAIRKWWTLCVTFVVAVITKTTPEEEVNESDRCSIDNNFGSGSQEDHIVNITDASDNSTVVSDSIQNQIDQTQQAQHANTAIKVTGSWVKFLCRLFNMVCEICLAWLNQENSSNKLKNTVYWKVTLLISMVCLVISVVELTVEIKVSGAEWRRRGYCCWLYYPQGQRFGNFFLYFGVGSSGIQFIINLITVLKMNKCVKFEPVPLLLSIAHFIWCYKESLNKCTFHGCALQCPHCFRLCRGNELESNPFL